MRMSKGKLIINVCIITLIVIETILLVTYLRDYACEITEKPYVMSESGDGEWRAVFECDDLDDKQASAYLMYKGSKDGIAEKVKTRVLINGEPETAWSEKYDRTYEWIGQVSRKKDVYVRNDELLNKLLYKEYNYWFVEGYNFREVDEIKINVEWISDDEQKESSLLLDVKKARKSYKKTIHRVMLMKALRRDEF